jgi:hypothetical protein
MNAIFRPASRQKSKLRMAIDGPAGSGKTFTALRFAFAIAGPGGRVAVINSESGAVEKYLGLAPDGTPFTFDVCELDDFAPTKYTEAILGAGRAGYDVLVIDSLSHAWAGSGGALEIKDKKSAGSNANSFTAWKDVTPMHNQMIDAILRSPCHIIATMRSKTEYILEVDSKGRSIPRKVGMAPIQRAGMEYEFDLYCSVDAEHILRVSKSRCPELDEAMSVKPGATFIMPIVSWLNDGSDAPAEKFAVTEEDLRLLERRVEGEKPPAPPKSVAELMAEAAAKVEKVEAKAEAEAKPTELPPQTTGPQVQTTGADQPGDGDSTAEQRARITELYSILQISPEQQAAILAKRGLTVLRSLTAEQAATIISGLEKKLPAATTLVDKGPDQAEGASHIGVHSAPTNGPCTDQQIVAIKQALVEWEQSEEGVTEKFIAAMNAAGFAKMKDLTFEQARAELANIEAKNIANFFAASLVPVAT